MRRFQTATVWPSAPGLLRAAEKPDVLVLLTDQWSARYVGWDNPEVRTPTLDPSVTGLMT